MIYSFKSLVDMPHVEWSCSGGIWNIRTSNNGWGSLPHWYSIFKWYIIKFLQQYKIFQHQTHHSTSVKKWEQDSINIYSENLITFLCFSFITYKVRKISIYRIIGGFNKMMHVKWLKNVLVILALFVALTTISIIFNTRN